MSLDKERLDEILRMHVDHYASASLCACHDLIPELVEAIVPRDLGPVKGLQPLLDALKAQATEERGSAVGVYTIASNTQTGEAYFYGTDAAGRDFMLRMTPRELQRLTIQMRGVLGISG
jgi:ABC-type dipeptide/oligopeptide/nickel transport system permease subunit